MFVCERGDSSRAPARVVDIGGKGQLRIVLLLVVPSPIGRPVIISLFSSFLRMGR